VEQLLGLLAIQPREQLVTQVETQVAIQVQIHVLMQVNTESRILLPVLPGELRRVLREMQRTFRRELGAARAGLLPSASYAPGLWSTKIYSESPAVNAFLQPLPRRLVSSYVGKAYLRPPRTASSRALASARSCGSRQGSRSRSRRRRRSSRACASRRTSESRTLSNSRCERRRWCSRSS